VYGMNLEGCDLVKVQVNDVIHGRTSLTLADLELFSWVLIVVKLAAGDNLVI